MKTIKTTVLLRSAKILRKSRILEETHGHSDFSEKPSANAGVKNFLKSSALHPRDDTDRLYVSRKEGGRGLTSIQDSVNASIQRL